MRIGPKSLNDCFQEGADARVAGRRKTDNPYAIGTEGRDEWAEGWAATLDLDEEDDPKSDRGDCGEDPSRG